MRKGPKLLEQYIN